MIRKTKSDSKESFTMGTSVNYKIMLIVVLVIAIALSASTYIGVVTESEVLHNSLIQKGKNLTSNIASSTKSAFWSLNWLFVEDLLKEFSKSGNEDIVYIKIIKPNGEVYLADDKQYYGKQVDAELLFDKFTILSDQQVNNWQDESGVLLVHPVLIGKDIWYILLALSTKSIHDSLTNLIFKNIALGGVLLFLSSAIFFILSRSFSKPIRDLISATRIISEGERDQYIAVTSRDEIGFLAHSMNNMLQSINDAESALRASNERFVAVLDSIDATIYVADLETNEVLFMNRAMKLAFGSAGEGELCYKVFRGRDVPCDRCKNRELHNGKGDWDGRLVWEEFNPLNERWYANYDRIIHWIDNRLVHLQVAFDITQTKELEEQRREAEAKLQQSQKMEAIGKLAGGVAHDLNNILSGIINYPELILLDLPEDHKLRKPIDNMRKAGERASVIVNDLLTLARRGLSINEVINLNKVISNYLASPEHSKLFSFHPEVTIEFGAEQELHCIKGSPVHLSKVVMNLLANAAEAIPEKGKIQIKTSNVVLAEELDGFEPVEPGEYACLTVTDTGVGMEKEYQKKIFEPFFTNKIMGKSGTGLGMAVIWGTVKDHNGFVDLQSEVGKGTSFSLYFPMTNEQPSERVLENTDLGSYGSPGATILVVDDMDSQRELVKDMLELLQYTVILVPSGEEAINYLKENEADLVLLDMLMDPGINGLETYKRIRKIKPDQPTIITSGYSESEDVKEALALGARRYLRKPYKLSVLAKILYDELKTEVSG